jgi:hypothetical protein
LIVMIISADHIQRVGDGVLCPGPEYLQNLVMSVKRGVADMVVKAPPPTAATAPVASPSAFAQLRNAARMSPRKVNCPSEANSEAHFA